MRKFIQKLQEIDRGSSRPISDRELFELKEFLGHRGLKMVMVDGRAELSEEAVAHDDIRSMTESDAVRLFKSINPDTFSRKTPLTDRFPGKSPNKIGDSYKGRTMGGGVPGQRSYGGGRGGSSIKDGPIKRGGR